MPSKKLTQQEKRERQSTAPSLQSLETPLEGVSVSCAPSSGLSVCLSRYQNCPNLLSKGPNLRVDIIDRTQKLLFHDVSWHGWNLRLMKGDVRGGEGG